MTITSQKLHNAGELRKRIEKGLQLMENCRLCPRDCRVDRCNGEIGFCGIGRRARVSSFAPHFGEEDPLVGEHGSGTIFFSSCNLRCCFCQNFEISFSPDAGTEVSPEELAAIMLRLQNQGCHNINFVSPSHVVVQLLEAIEIALDGGLAVPIVFNSSAYDSVQALHLLAGVIDIYMPDFKFWSKSSAEKYCGAGDYPEIARRSVQEMHRQVGELSVDQRGLATRGLLLRHLVMPEGLSETGMILRFIADTLSPSTYINIMDQYRPCGESGRYPELCRPLTGDEYRVALEYAAALGFTRIDKRDATSLLKKLGIL